MEVGPLTEIPAREEILTGWGRTSPSRATVIRPRSVEELETVVHSESARKVGLAPRGLGRSYGDAAQLGGGVVLDMTGLGGVVSEDLESGLVTLQAGVSLDSLMRRYLPAGWFVPVTPGTRYVTIGGAIAADVHGKNHHRDGSFGSQVRSMVLVAPSGTVECEPEGPHRDYFWATVGGMGLTGVVASATLQLIKVETAFMLVDTMRCANLEELIGEMTESDHRYRYSVAWIDCLATGGSLGRAVLTRGDHASLDDLPTRGGLRSVHRKDPLAFAPHSVASAPRIVPGGILNRFTVRAFNEAYFRHAPKLPSRSLEPISRFFHPLDGVSNWNRLYGPRGFLQYQVVLPFGAEAELRHCVESLARSGSSSFLGVLKRFGPSDPSPLSFPIPGWTLALDMPLGRAGLAGLLDDLDRVVASAGGRVYLAKDSRLDPDLVPLMYPRLGEWQAIRSKLDPQGVLASDLGRRLRLAT